MNILYPAQANNSYRTISAETAQQIREEIKRGEKIASVARKYGLNYYDVQQVLKLGDFSYQEMRSKRNERNSALAQEITDHIKSGANIAETGRKYGLSVYLVNKMLLANGTKNQLQEQRNAHAKNVTEEVKQGADVADVMSKYSLSYCAVKKIIARHIINYQELLDAYQASAQSRGKVTSEMEQKIIEEIKGGAKIAETAPRYSLSPPTVERIIKRNGINYRELMAERRRIKSDALAEKLLEGIKAGESLYHLVPKVGISEMEAKQILQEKGVNYHQFRQELKQGGKYVYSKRYIINKELSANIIRDIQMGGTKDGVARKYYVPRALVCRTIEKAGINYQQVLAERKRVSLGGQGESAATASPAVPKEHLIGELCEIATLLGRIPSSQDIKAFTKYHYNDYLAAFGNLMYAFMEPDFVKHRSTIPNLTVPRSLQGFRTPEQQEEYKLQLIRRLKEKTRMQGFAPDRDQMYKDEVYKYPKYHKAFGSIEKALKLAGLNGMQRWEKQSRMDKVNLMIVKLNILLGDLKKTTYQEETASVALLGTIISELENLQNVMGKAEYYIPGEGI